MFSLFFIHQGGSAEVELQKGQTFKFTTDKAFAEKGNGQIVWVDYENISKVVKVGNRIFVDDGLISLIATQVGKQKLDLLIKFRSISFSQGAMIRF